MEEIKEVRQLTKDEIDAYNLIIDKCGCECHLDTNLMHIAPCCRLTYDPKLSEGATTTFTKEEISKLLGE